MSVAFSSKQLAALHDDARQLLDRTRDHELDIEVLAASARTAITHAEAALFGFIVRTAANGLDGLIAAYEMRPAVIVMDVTMPVLDGIEATRLIKAAHATRHARVIAYTGEAAFDDTLSQKLFAAVLWKPAPLDAVIATVQQAAAL
jgi:two-component system cell cycle response regulator DivK